MPMHNMPTDNGDLHVKFVVKFPKKLTQKDRDLLVKIFDS